MEEIQKDDNDQRKWIKERSLFSAQVGKNVEDWQYLALTRMKGEERAY